MDVSVAETETEKKAVYALREEVYIAELGHPQSNADYVPGEDEADKSAEHLCIKQDGQLIGTVRLSFAADAPFRADYQTNYDIERFRQVIADDKMAMLSRFAVQRAYRASPTSINLIVAAAKRMYERRIELAFLDSTLNMIPVYESIGFRTYCQPYHQGTAGTLAPQLLVVGDVEYVRSIGSPLAALAVEAPPISATAARLLAVLPPQPAIISALRHKDAFWQPVFAALDRPPHMRGGLAALGDSDVRGLLSRSYVIEFPAGAVLVHSGHIAWERWLVLAGAVEVDGSTALPGELVGGGRDLLTSRHGVNARIGVNGATLLSIDEGKLQQLLRGRSAARARMLANLVGTAPKPVRGPDGSGLLTPETKK